MTRGCGAQGGDVSGRSQGVRVETKGPRMLAVHFCAPSPVQVDGHALTAKQCAAWKSVLAFVAVRAHPPNMGDICFCLLKIAPGDLSEHRYCLFQIRVS